ncbi:hypothetical protein HID58_044479 [Brassica napus]|uniref:Uncharacterized protein n=1 Tax=Brassica napus TaxID=3708 RepID=A0ABQ8BJF5_BRANA|nr:hypothetical protein HID58_044479 [Brassica napus]
MPILLCGSQGFVLSNVTAHRYTNSDVHKVTVFLLQNTFGGKQHVSGLGMVHIDLEQTHGSILLPRSQQQRFCISLSRMRYGEGMVVVKEVMETVIWFHGATNLSLSHLCTASSLCEKTRK